MAFPISLAYLKDIRIDDPEVIVFFQEWSEDALRFNMTEDAFWFAQILENLVTRHKAVITADPALRSKYETTITRARWAALPLLSEKEMLDIFENSFTFPLDDPDFDAWAKLKEKLISMPVYEERDALKKKIIDALLRNKEMITNKLFQSEGKNAPATVENWLRDYLRFVGAGPLNKVKQAQYLVESKNFGILPEPEREAVLRLIHFYERCRLSSLTVQGMEETIPVPPEEGEGGVGGVIREGQFEADDPDLVRELERQLDAVYPDRVIKTAIAKLRAQEKVFEAVLNSQKSVEEAARLKSLPPDELLRECGTVFMPVSFVKSDILKAYICLQTLAGKNLLVQILAEPNPVREEFVKYLRQEGRPEEAQQFQLSPTSPMSLGKFLRFVLQRRMRMDESQAAAIAVRIGNIMKSAGKPEYFNMAYFDQASGTFKWKS